MKSQTPVILLHQFIEPYGPVLDCFLTHYLYVHNVKPPERAKSVNWAGLVHFSLEMFG
jgi:hypothetical protein